MFQEHRLTNEAFRSQMATAVTALASLQHQVLATLAPAVPHVPQGHGVSRSGAQYYAGDSPRSTPRGIRAQGQTDFSPPRERRHHRSNAEAYGPPARSRSPPLGPSPVAS
ncbi:hypothetical protein PC120_g4265 [Phytophthora cactorum]|nr:hypothetical protein PC120_g4265 [Phytophthora cactorum]